MIKINLLPREERPRRKIQVRVPQAAIVVVAIVMLGGMVVYYRALRGEIEGLRSDAVATRNEIAKNKQIVRLVEQYLRDKQQLQGRLTLIQRLVTAQGASVRLLDGISQMLPNEVWLVGMTKVPGKLVIQGYASSHFGVANLMEALARLKPTIGGVELAFTERQLFENKPVERFEIIAALPG